MGPLAALPERGRVAAGEGGPGVADPAHPPVRGQAGRVRGASPGSAGDNIGAEPSAWPALRVRQSRGRSGHARIEGPGDDPGDDARGIGLRGRGRLRRARDPEAVARHDRGLHQGESRAEAIRALPGRHHPAAASHRQRVGRTADRPGGDAGEHALGHLWRLLGRGLPVPDRHARRRAQREAQLLGVQPVPRAPEPRGPAEGDVGVLRRARRVSPDVRRHDERHGAARPVLHEGTQVRVVARGSPQREQHPGLGLPQPGRGRERKPADLPPLPAAAQADDGAGPAPLLRSLRAAGGAPSTSTTPWSRRRRRSSRRSPRSGRTTRRSCAGPSTERWIDMYPNAGKRSGAYSNGARTTCTRTCC